VICTVLVLLILQVPAASCPDAPECRRLALEASARGDYEGFHDLAWRAVQKGRRNDPDLMAMLARAQALSGRPGDALVMLARLADLGAGSDAPSSEDFRVVRTLPGWPEVEAKLTGKPAPSAPLAPSAPSAPLAPAPSAPLAPLAPTPKETISFAAPGISPLGLAHDAVSRRFVLGDRHAQRLLVIDEASHNVVNYVSAASAGFYERLEGFAIDARRGDLWVVSSRGESDASASILHKLQLVSGRLLSQSVAPERAGPVRLVAVTVGGDGTVYALDGLDARIFRLRPGARALEQVLRLDARRATALTVADDRTLFVAAESGIVHVDLTSRAATPIKSADPLTDIESLAWRAGALLGVQRVAQSSLIIRVPLEPSGTRALPRQILAASPSATVGALARDAFYYLSDATTIRRVPLR
jgi:hypothetical protein